MNDIPNRNSKLFFPIFLSFVLGLILGFVASNVIFQMKNKQIGNENIGSPGTTVNSKNQSGDNAMSLSNSQNIPQKAFFLQGIIERIDENNLTVRNFFDEKDVYSVKINSKTKIFKAGVFGVLNSQENEIKISDLKTGDKITAESFDSIEDRNEFEARSISVAVSD